MVKSEQNSPPRTARKKKLGKSDQKRVEDLANLAWALAHPVRIQIVQLLLQQSPCLCGEIVAELPLAQSTVSQHLKILKQSGLVVAKTESPRVFYRLNTQVLDRLKRAICDLDARE